MFLQNVPSLPKVDIKQAIPTSQLQKSLTKMSKLSRGPSLFFPRITLNQLISSSWGTTSFTKGRISLLSLLYWLVQIIFSILLLSGCCNIILLVLKQHIKSGCNYFKNFFCYATCSIVVLYLYWNILNYLTYCMFLVYA